MTSPPTASRAAELARLMITYGPRWHITATIPGTGPRVLTATELGTGRRIRARSEPELEARLIQEPAQVSAAPASLRTECAD